MPIRHILPTIMKNNAFPVEDHRLFESLGFKCGLEIHQQLDTRHKLFCRCPVGLTHERHDAEILRHMRPTLSELGEYDGTALMEFKTKKNVIYRLYRDRTCTYEMDDTPPFFINQEAVDIAIQLALLFNCKIIDELHVVRKQYLDGSIPTGFQRTMIIGIDGWIPFKNGKIKITQINLEEEACREISDIGHEIVFATDRLSIPLVEVITDCSLKNPREAADACRLLGNSMKVSRLVRRGIGTVRQDVNVSINGGDRVEIKGVFKVGNIIKLTAIEAHRQTRLLRLKEIFLNRFPNPDQIQYRELSFTDLFRGTATEIGRRLERDQPLKVAGLLLPDMADLITTELQPGRNFGFELAGRVKVIACLDCRPNLFFHSHRPDYDLPDTLWDKIKVRCPLKKNDDIVLICGPSEDVVTAVNEIKIRISELAIGIIRETRQDLKDGTTDFERILPGPDRMYPDTDHPPVKIAEERVRKNEKKLREPLWEKQKRWRTLGLSEALVAALSLSPHADLFDKLTADSKVNPKKAAHICTAVMVGLRRAGYDLHQKYDSQLYDIIRQSLIDDRTNDELKTRVIALAKDKIPETTPRPPFNPDPAEEIWKTAVKEFQGFHKNRSKEKFRRFITGKLLEQFPSPSLIIPWINKKLETEKTLQFS